MARCVVERNISNDDIYNLSLYEGYLIIDTRSRELYDEHHIISAFSLPPPTPGIGESREEQLKKFIETTIQYYSPERWSPVIIYGDETAPAHEHAVWLVEFIRELVNTSIYQSTEKNTEDFITGFIESIKSRTKEIWFLQSYDEFRAEFPILCGPSSIGFENLEMLPQKITANVFLGARSVDWSNVSLLKKLGITHAVVDAEKVQNGHFPDGIEILCINLPDRTTGPEDSPIIQRIFDTVNSFIASAISLSGGKILLALHGRSRSAGLASAWLMASERLPAEIAFQRVCDKCKTVSSIDINFVHMDELLERPIPLTLGT
jgi:protein-tyrosine phosphatase